MAWNTTSTVAAKVKKAVSAIGTFKIAAAIQIVAQRYPESTAAAIAQNAASCMNPSSGWVVSLLSLDLTEHPVFYSAAAAVIALMMLSRR